MCGLVGVFTTSGLGMSHNDAKILRDLTIADTVRGADATGVLYHKTERGSSHKLWYIKDAVPGPLLFTGDRRASELEGSRFAVVHNRSATMGCLSKESAHPFVCTNTAGMHNGTVQNFERVLKNVSKGVLVDSHAIIEALGQAGSSAEDASSVLVSIEFGAYALVWFDHRVQQLRIARNADRPLFFATTYGSVWFASELGMLEWVLSRNKISPRKSWSLKPHRLVGIPVDGGPAEVLDYSSKLPKLASWGGGGRYPAQHYSWQEDDDDYDSAAAARWGSGKPFTRTATQPVYVDALSRSTLGFASLPSAVLTELYGAARKFMGVDTWLTEGRYEDLAKTYAARADEFAKEAGRSLETDKVTVPVHVHGVVDGRLLGYIYTPEDELVPVAVGTWTSNELLKDAMRITELGQVAVVEGLEMTGIRMYHSGEVIMRLGVTQYKVNPVVYAGDSLASAAEVDLDNHPEQVAYSCTPDWASAWLPSKQVVAH